MTNVPLGIPHRTATMLCFANSLMYIRIGIYQGYYGYSCALYAISEQIKKTNRECIRHTRVELDLSRPLSACFLMFITIIDSSEYAGAVRGTDAVSLL